MTDVPYSKVTVIVETGGNRTITVVPMVEMVEFETKNDDTGVLESISFNLAYPLMHPINGITYYLAEQTGNHEEDVTQTIFLALANTELKPTLDGSHEIANVATVIAKGLVAMGLTVTAAKMDEKALARPSAPAELKTYSRQMDSIGLSAVLEGIVPKYAEQLTAELENEIPKNVDGTFEYYTEYQNDDDTYTLIVEWTPKALSTRKRSS